MRYGFQSLITPPRLLAYLLLAVVALLVFGAGSLRWRGMAPSPSLELSMQVEATSKSVVGTHKLMPGAAVYNGDTLAFKFSVSEAAYVYAVSYSAKDWSQVLFPNDQQPEQLLLRGRTLRVPSGSATWEVTSEPGEEDILAVASPRPMDQALASRLRLPWPPASQVPGTSRGGEKPKLPPPPPPPPPPDEKESPPPKKGKISTERDGVRIERDEPTHTVRAASGPDGIAVIRFVLKHTR